MNEKHTDVLFEFIKHFHYIPKTPNDIEYDEKEYETLLLKCIEDNLDYTIEKYGTIPAKESKYPEVFIN